MEYCIHPTEYRTDRTEYSLGCTEYRAGCVDYRVDRRTIVKVVRTFLLMVRNIIDIIVHGILCRLYCLSYRSHEISDRLYRIYNIEAIAQTNMVRKLRKRFFVCLFVCLFVCFLLFFFSFFFIRYRILCCATIS